jgi:hypothetical protein
MSAGYQAVQSIHAMRQFTAEHPDIDNEWFLTSNYLGLLAAKDESELLEIVRKAALEDIRYSIFREPDVDNAITAIALEPGEKSKRLCSRLPLALKEMSKIGDIK